MSRLEKVWLVLPPADEVASWEPGSVFETWQQAVAVLTKDRTIAVKVEEISPNRVLITSVDEDEDDYKVEIIAVPIEYR